MMIRRRILIAQNGCSTAASILQALNEAAFEVEQVSDIAQVIKKAIEFRPALILCVVCSWDDRLHELFWELAELNTTRSIRRVVLAAEALPDERVAALDAGADDFLTQAISPRELVARVQAVLRCYQSVSVEDDCQSLGPLHLFREGMEVKIGGQRTKLSPREFGLLHYLMNRPGRVISRDELLENVWYPSGEIEERRVVDVYIWRLREKIEEDPTHPRFLITRRGEGYSLIDPDGTPA